MHTAATRAKLNLSLRIVGRRADGYHEMQSLVAFADIGDGLTAAPSSAGVSTIRVHGPFAEARLAEDNLVLRAAALLAPEFAVAFSLEKRLPIASGIGGGSGDAAAALRLVNELAGLGHSEAMLARLGATLGADVPVCLHGHACWMEGIGEIITPLPPMPPFSVLMVNPGIACPTLGVFSAYRQMDAGFSSYADMPGFASSQALLAWLNEAGNDLQPAAIRLHPVIADVLSILQNLPGTRLARMSGSGATCFALFEDEAACATAKHALRQSHGAWWIASGRLC